MHAQQTQPTIRLCDAGTFIDWFADGDDAVTRANDWEISAQRLRVVGQMLADDGGDEVVTMVVADA